ncbi:IclR family transcriptional regulator domain-containing protein [Streptomyces decoyicus]
MRFSSGPPAGPEPGAGTGPDLRSAGRGGTGVGAAVYLAVYRKGDVERLAVTDDPESSSGARWADFRTAAGAHAIGQCLLAQLDQVSSREHHARHPVPLITPFSVRSQDELRHCLDTVRCHRGSFLVRTYAQGTACSALPVQVGAAAGASALSLRTDELRRLRSVTDRLRRMAEATLTTLAFSVSI